MKVFDPEVQLTLDSISWIDEKSPVTFELVRRKRTDAEIVEYCAAWDAAWDATGSARGEEFRSAAFAAVSKALRPTVVLLHESALNLVERMVAA